jgi:hypothetical protein
LQRCTQKKWSRWIAEGGWIFSNLQGLKKKWLRIGMMTNILEMQGFQGGHFQGKEVCSKHQKMT